MALPVVIATNGFGLPVTEASNGKGLPVEIAANGFGRPVVYVASGGMPVVTSGVSYSAEATALFARFTTPPTDARKTLINNMIVSLKAAGVWAKLDAFYVLAAADAQAARQNWIQDLYNLTPVASPIFTADRGYVGDGSSSYLDTGFNPTTALSPKFTLNDCSLSAWALDLTGNGRSGNNFARIGWASTPTHYSRANDATTANGAVSPSARMFSLSRSAAGSYVQRVDGADFATVANASTALATASLRALSAEVVYGNGAQCHLSFGASLTTAQDIAQFSALSTYLTAVGAA